MNCIPNLPCALTVESLWLCDCYKHLHSCDTWEVPPPKMDNTEYIFCGNIWTPLIVSILIKDFTHEYTCVRFWLLILTLVYSLPQSFRQFYWFQWGRFTLWCPESEPDIERTEVCNYLVPLGILLCWLWVARDPLYDLIVSVYPKWCVPGSWVNCKLNSWFQMQEWISLWW